MSDQTPVLIHVNQQVRIPGFPNDFLSQHMRFRPADKTLLLNTPEGVVPFTEEDTMQIKVLDLDVPTFLRAQMHNQGWTGMSMGRLVTELHLTYLSEV